MIEMVKPGSVLASSEVRISVLRKADIARVTLSSGILVWKLLS